ncbi:MAG: hypothetical protein JW953_01525 [Anaerolineae bacterium]|nr:hypothetical protein [Anaerolineae bacterium]
MTTIYQGDSYGYNFLATKTASTQRNATGSGMSNHLSGLAAPGLYPVDADIVSDAGLEGAAREYKQTFVRKQSHTDDGQTVDQLPDIKEGDNYIVDGITYRVRSAAEWGNMLHLVIGELKGAA